MDIVVLGIDLGKNVCSIVGLGAEGQVLVRRRMRRESVAAFTRKWPSSVVAMEACCGAHHLGQQLAAQGHEVRLISPEYVRPYVKAQKNDDRDAEAIAEAATRPTMRFVEIKSEMQLEMQTLHRARERLVAERRVDQSSALGSAGTRNHRSPRPPQIGEAAAWHPGRRVVESEHPHPMPDQ